MVWTRKYDSIPGTVGAAPIRILGHMGQSLLMFSRVISGFIRYRQLKTYAHADWLLVIEQAFKSELVCGNQYAITCGFTSSLSKQSELSYQVAGLYN